jgi:hypothetical protein
MLSPMVNGRRAAGLWVADGPTTSREGAVVLSVRPS